MGAHSFCTIHEDVDARYEKMRVVWYACKALKISPPDEVKEYFNWSEPEPIGPEISGNEIKAAIKAIDADHIDGYIIDIKALPEKARFIRAGTSY